MTSQVRRLGKCQASRKVTARSSPGSRLTVAASDAVGESASPGGRSSIAPSALKSSQKSSSASPQGTSYQAARAVTD